jgi:hypothetical protein
LVLNAMLKKLLNIINFQRIRDWLLGRSIRYRQGARLRCINLEHD